MELEEQFLLAPEEPSPGLLSTFALLPWDLTGGDAHGHCLQGKACFPWSRMSSYCVPEIWHVHPDMQDLLVPLKVPSGGQHVAASVWSGGH